MKLQELINDSELDMTLDEVKAFFMGFLFAEKPFPFNKAFKELLPENPGPQMELETELKKLWSGLESKLKIEAANLFPKNLDIRSSIDHSRNKLDYLLTAMSLAGTDPDSCKNEDLAEILDELEDLVMEMDEYLSDAKASKEDGEELMEILLSTWGQFLKIK